MSYGFIVNIEFTAVQKII